MHLDLVREMRKLTDVPVVIGALGIVRKSPCKKVKEMKVMRSVSTIQMTALLKAARIIQKICSHLISNVIQQLL